MVNVRWKITFWSENWFFWFVRRPYFTAKGSNRIGKCSLYLRNMFLNQENIIKFFSKQEKFIQSINVLSLLLENLTLNKNIYQNKNNFLITKNLFLARKHFLFQIKVSYSGIIFLNQDKFSYRRDWKICLIWINFLFSENLFIFSWFQNMFLRWRKYFSVSLEAFAVRGYVHTLQIYRTWDSWLTVDDWSISKTILSVYMAQKHDKLTVFEKF